MRNTQKHSKNLSSRISFPKSLTLVLLILASVSLSSAAGCGAFLDTFKSKDDKVQKDQKPGKDDGKQDVNDGNDDTDGSNGGNQGGDGDGTGTVGGGGTGTEDGNGGDGQGHGDGQGDGTDDAAKKRCAGGPLSAPIPNCRPKMKPSSGDPQQDCVDRTNQLRWECQCLPPLERWYDGEACAKKHAEYDEAHHLPHAGFEANICSPGGFAQNEGIGHSSFHAFNEHGLQNMWDEGPGVPYVKHGHYINMSNLNYKKVACAKGSNGNRYVQNFSN